jgi:hypothetical protein
MDAFQPRTPAAVIVDAITRRREGAGHPDERLLAIHGRRDLGKLGALGTVRIVAIFSHFSCLL